LPSPTAGRRGRVLECCNTPLPPLANESYGLKNAASSTNKSGEPEYRHWTPGLFFCQAALLKSLPDAKKLTRRRLGCRQARGAIQRCVKDVCLAHVLRSAGRRRDGSFSLPDCRQEAPICSDYSQSLSSRWSNHRFDAMLARWHVSGSWDSWDKSMRQRRLSVATRAPKIPTGWSGLADPAGNS
jgi:hypothetical protein